MKKKLLSIIMIGTLCLAAGCSGEDKKENDNTTVAESTTEATEADAKTEEKITEEATTEAEGITFNEWVKRVYDSVDANCKEPGSKFAYFYDDSIPGYMDIQVVDDRIFFTYNDGDRDFFSVKYDIVYRSLDISFSMDYDDGYRVYYIGQNSIEGMQPKEVENFLKTVLTSGDENLIIDNDDQREVDLQGDLYKLCARFVSFSDSVLSDSGISFADIDVSFGEEYKKYSVDDDIQAEHDFDFEKHSFADGVCKDCGKDFIDSIMDCVGQLDVYKGEITSYAFEHLKNTVGSDDYVSISNDGGDVCFNYSSTAYGDRASTLVHLVLYKDTDTCQFVLSAGMDEDVDDEGIISYKNHTIIRLYVPVSELGDIMASKDSLVKKISGDTEDYNMELIVDGEFKADCTAADISDEMYDLFIGEYGNYMASFEEALNSMNLSFTDIGVEVTK